MNYLLMIVHLVVLTSPLYSMDFFISMKRYLTCPHQKIETAERFVHEFPLMTLKNVQFRYQRCSAATQKKIDEHFSENENKQLSGIFLLTKCPEQKICKNIALSIFDGNETAADKFLRLPIRKSYILYQWAHDVHEGKAGIPSSFNIKSIDLIFQLSDEIKRAAILVNNNKSNQLYVGREDIKTLRTIIDNSKTSENVFMGQKFSYRKKYSKDDLGACVLAAVMTSGFCYVFLAPIGLSRLIENYCCSKITIDNSLPEKIKQLTELVHLSGKLSLLDAVRNPADNITYSFIDRCKINIPFLSIIPGVGCLIHFLKGKMLFEDHLLFGGATALGFFCSYLPFERLPGGFLGLCAAILIISFAVFNAMRYQYECSWQCEEISWYDINKTLERTDIMIPEESRVIN